MELKHTWLGDGVAVLVQSRTAPLQLELCKLTALTALGMVSAINHAKASATANSDLGALLCTLCWTPQGTLCVNHALTTPLTSLSNSIHSTFSGSLLD